MYLKLNCKTGTEAQLYAMPSTLHSVHMTEHLQVTLFTCSAAAICSNMFN